MFADLHLHTSFSDGTYSPEELAANGKKHSLAAMALTDHDTMEGCPRMAAACEALGIEFIPGTELTSEIKGVEVHLLGYFLDIKNMRLLKEIGDFQRVRQQRIYEIVARINELDIPLKAESVFAIANCQSPGRPHVGRALVQGGFCRTMDEAFERFLKKYRPAYVPKAKMSARHGIELIHQAGGLAVAAHPALNQTDEVIPKLVEAGLDGIECFHTKHSPSDSKRYLRLAEQYNLLVTGGSDCHGMSKGKPLIGSVKLPYEYIEKMKVALDRRRAASNQPSPGKAQAI
ncbi:MAG: PHP domain-containing protein [Verrucomicrobia bacterium]|nr:PHP domain-containing protein [Verrucomicrobiota bacterium]